MKIVLPFYPDPIYRPPPRPPENLQPQNSESKAETSPKIDTEFKENSPYQEGIIHLPITIKDIQAGYLVSSYFKDIYLYIAQNKLPTTKSAIRKIEALAEKYILLDSLLFKIVSCPENETTVLASMHK